MFSLAAPLALWLAASPVSAATDAFETTLAAGAATIQERAAAARRTMFAPAADLAVRIRNAFSATASADTARCLRDPACREPMVVAHRTSGFDAPENSVGGVQGAVNAGIPLIETDIRFAKDGTWVMLHDPTLDRTTTLQGPVSQRAWAELQNARLEDGEPLPRFQDLYAASRGRAVLVLDLKVNAAAAVADWIAQNGSFDDLIFFASDPATLASCFKARARHPQMMVMARVEAGMGWDEALAAYGGGLPMIVHPNLPPTGLADDLRARGAKLYATLIGHDCVPRWRDDMAHILIRRGAVLMDTDHPLWLKDLIDGLRNSSSLAAAAARRGN